jgi:hypothetical protein
MSDNATLVSVHPADGVDAGPPHRSGEVAGSFLFMAAQVVESGRQRTVKPEWWIVLKGCYERLRTWLTTATPLLATQGDFLRRLAR